MADQPHVDLVQPALVLRALNGDQRQRARRNAWHVFAALLLLTGLALANKPSFVVFHTFAELFVIIIAVSTGLIAWNARAYLDNDYLLFVGIGQIFVAIIDVVHTLGFRGMGVFPNSGPSLSTETWIAARYLGSLSLMAATLFIRRRVPVAATLALFAAATGLLVAAIFTGTFPTCYDHGLTPFKIVSEFVIAALYASSAWLLFRQRASFDRTVLNLILASILIRVAAELTFAVYSDVSDAFSFAGHYLRIIAFYLLYKAILETGLVRPYAIVLRDLRQREQQLRNSMQELETFSYSVSHDLRSPLTVIDGFAQLLALDEADRLTPEGRRHVQQIRATTRRMSQLIEDLLAFSRVSRSGLDVERVDVTALAREVAEQLRAAHPQRTVVFEIEDGMAGRADARLLRVVLENLLGNAWKFTSRNPSAKIEIRAAEAGNESIFSIRDNGAGFDMSEAAGRLFRPFHRLHDANEFEGTGIGLATVARIIERHHGRVWAESQRDKGTTVYFALPK